MFSKIQVLGLLAATAAAAPATQELPPFTLIATHSGDSRVHLRAIDAADSHFWLGRETSTLCPAGLPAGSCPTPGNTTAFRAYSTSSKISMNAVVPGGQQVFIDSTGFLRFTLAHEETIPANSISDGFKYTPPTEQGRVGTFDTPKPLVACPTEQQGEYQIKAVLEGLDCKDCIDISAVGGDVLQSGPSAFQYV